MAAVQAPESEDQTKLHGFTENRQAPLPELDATLHEMEHAQAGVRLVWLERDEANMTFGIACPTLPGDDTGAWQLAAKLLSLEYLWNAVRVQSTTADTWYWQGVGYAERCRRRQELLSATPDTLLALADALEGALQGGVCVVGGQPQLEACGLDHIESV